MGKAGDREFDWIATLAYASGVAVIAPSLAALAVAVIAVVRTLI